MFELLLIVALAVVTIKCLSWKARARYWANRDLGIPPQFEMTTFDGQRLPMWCPNCKRALPTSKYN